MRRRLALPKHFVRNSTKAPFLFCEAFGVRTRPRVALTHRHYIMRLSIMQSRRGLQLDRVVLLEPLALDAYETAVTGFVGPLRQTPMFSPGVSQNGAAGTQAT